MLSVLMTLLIQVLSGAWTAFVTLLSPEAPVMEAVGRWLGSLHGSDSQAAVVGRTEDSWVVLVVFLGLISPTVMEFTCQLSSCEGT